MLSRTGCIAGLVCWVAGATWTFAEPIPKFARDGAAAVERPAVELTPLTIQKRLKQVENAANLDEPVRKSLIEKYNAALEHLQSAEEHKEKAEELRKKTEAAPKELERLKAELKDPPPAILPPAKADMGLTEMQEALAKAEKDYEALQKELAELENESAHRADRRTEIPGLLESIRDQLEEIETQAGASPPGGVAFDPQVVAERVLLTARRRALEHELAVYEEELRHYELTVDLIEVRRDHALVFTERVEQHLKAWREAVNERREREAAEQAQEARESVRHAHPAIRRLAEENAALTAQRQELVARIEIATKSHEALQEQLDVLEKLYKRVNKRVERVGLTESIGVLLRKQQESIPDVGEHVRFIDERKAEISQLSLQVIDFEDQRATLADIDARAERILSETRPARRMKQPSLAEIRETLEATREILDLLIADTNDYIEKLVELDTTELELVEETRKFSNFTREYILWIRSAELPRDSDVAELRGACRWLVAPGRWSAVLQTFAGDARKRPITWLSVLAALATLALSPRLWRRLLRKAGRDAAHHLATSVWPTALSLLATVVLSAVVPAALWLAGWRLGRLADGSEFLLAVARGLEGSALLLATVNFTRHLCRSHGLGEAHFGWPAPVLDLIRRSLWWLTAAGLPLAGIVLMTEAQSDETIKNSLGRVAFIGFQILLLAGAHRVWHAPQGLLRQLRTGWRNQWWIRLCRLGHAVSILAPVALTALALAGYYYTAVQLAQRLVVTSWLVGGLLVLHATLLRWVLVAYRDLAVKRVREQRAAEAAATDHQPATTAAETTVQLADINLQTRALLGLVMCGVFLIGCSVIWVEVLPALEILDQVQIWPHPFAKIVEPLEGQPRPIVVTLGELAAAVLILLVTAVATRNIPGLAEITVLRHLKLDAGARYAVGAVTQYAITVFGVSMAFSRVGVGWKDVQWLAAGMTVGLGFGLQEIFANFASGLLLLFERPIRVGDTVSVGDVIGKVTRIRIRATTIVDGDMRELVVPNKEFISGKVMNWTLSDTTSRMTIKVGVPRGSDPDLVRQILLHVAATHPLVLKDPPPHALFDEFADDTLNFTLRVYMGSRDVYNQLRHELNAGINAAFQQSGIDRTHPPAAAPVQTLPHVA
ncbi:MAG: mechanosensitive ion channel domain-containing protein [Deltaproteobacteria bacterium]